MNYDDLKKLIEVKTCDSDELYNELVNKYGEQIVDEFFELYANEESVENDINKINTIMNCTDISYESSAQSIEKISSDSVKMYLEEIGDLPLLTAEEEMIICIKMCELRDKLILEKITIDTINNRLKRFNYDINFRDSNNVDGLKKKLNYLITMEKDDKIQNKQEFIKLLNDLKLYLEYQNLVEKFVSHNLKLVVSIAKKYTGRGLDFLDLVQDGNLGLKKAIEKFDINKGFKLSTYATHWIKQYITRSISDKSKLIRYPVHFFDTTNKLKYIESILENNLERKPTNNEILEYCNSHGIRIDIDEEKINEIKRIDSTATLVSLNAQINEEDDSELIEFIVSKDDISVEDQVEKNFLKTDLMEVLDGLTNRQKLIVLLRYGFKIYDYLSIDEFKMMFYGTEMSDFDIEEKYKEICREQKEYTLEEIGSLIGLTRERVRQIETKAISRLQEKKEIFTR